LEEEMDGNMCMNGYWLCGAWSLGLVT